MSTRTVSCKGCGEELEESPDADPATRDPCPQCGSTSRVVNVRVEERVHIVDSARLSMRNYFSTYLLWAGHHTSDLAATMEGAHTGRSRFDLQHRGYVLAAILAAEAFLEAMVNELFQDAVDRHNLAGDGYLAPLSSDVHLLMARAWTAAGGEGD
jgi:hypothetical protein